jgi:hypothetical protein
MSMSDKTNDKQKHVYRIGIIGAGAAGLKAAEVIVAKARSDMPVDVEIELTFLEARNRIGGRALSTDLKGNSCINGIKWNVSDDNNSCDVDLLEFGAQWAHDVGVAGHALTPLIPKSGLLLSIPEQYTNSQNVVLNYTNDEFPDLNENEIESLDVWMEEIVADTVLRYDIMTNYNHDHDDIDIDNEYSELGESSHNKYGQGSGEMMKMSNVISPPSPSKLFTSIIDASAEDIANIAFTQENIKRWWERKNLGKQVSGPPTPRGRSGSNVEDTRWFADDFDDIRASDSMTMNEGSLKRISSVPEHYQEEETDEFTLPYPSEQLINLAKRITLNNFANYYGLPGSNIGYAALESQVEHSEEHKVVQNGYARIMGYLGKDINLVETSKSTSTFASTSATKATTPISISVSAADATNIELNRTVRHIWQGIDENTGKSIVRITTVESPDTAEWKLSGKYIVPKATPSSENKDEKHHIFDKVICTLPLGVLKHLCHFPSCYKTHSKDTNFKQLFHPPLPLSIRNSLNKLDMGLLTKLVLLWDNPIEWEQIDMKRRFIFPGSNKDTFTMIVNLHNDVYHSKTQYGYVLYSALPFAEMIETMPNEEIAELGMDCITKGLNELYYRNIKNQNIDMVIPDEGTVSVGEIDVDVDIEKENKSAGGVGNRLVTKEELPKPSNIYTTRWLHDPYSLGAYSCMPKNAQLDDFEVFATPFDNVHFAGEHTQKKDFGCLHAALESGERAAKNVLKELNLNS